MASLTPLWEDFSYKSHQVVGIQWMMQRESNENGQRGGLLCDEMGLGKTAQAIALLDHIWRRESIRGPFLIVAPLSTLAHWQRELEEWTDLSVLNYYGRAESRDVMHQYEWHFEGPPSMPVLTTTRALPTGTSGTLKGSPHSRRLLRRR